MSRNAAFAVLLCSAGVASAQVVNGSFELNALSAPNRVGLDQLASWSWAGTSMLLERGVNTVSNIAAQTGEQFVSFGHNGGFNTSISQVITTTPGNVYEVGFWVAAIQGDGEQHLTASAIDTATASTLGSVVAVSNLRSDGWQFAGYSFTATGGSTQIRFVHTLGSNASNQVLDNVTVTPSPAGALVLAGAGLTATRRRR